MRIHRTVYYLAAVALLAAACGGAADPESGGGLLETSTTTTEPDQTTKSTDTPTTSAIDAPIGELPSGPSALRNRQSADLPEPLIDPNDIISGGPSPDGIPPIEDPQFLPVADSLDLLSDDEPVVALEIDGDARAYPVSVMIWHEIVNDTVGGVPVSVTYCPLCNSAVTYGREINGVETTFGTSGSLFASALVMYDRATESLWTHFDGRAVVGTLTGTQLDVYGSPLMAWSDFRVAYPDGQVLDPERTGFRRNYGSNPYVGYDNADSRPFLFAGDVDARARAKERVVGVSHNGVDVAYSLQSLSGDGPQATAVDHGGADLIILWKPGQSTALEGDTVDSGRDVGTVGVFVPVVDGRTVTITAEGDGFVDQETGSTWSVAGVATAGELSGQQLERIPHLDTFWFAWATYRPGSELVGTVG